ncbi:MAG TPA: hypothetical protein VE862_01070 [Candidatus Acidoferrum sp.]|nr:hypothetical protein [Candidatus Acidoferrum sp.]
MRVSWVLPVVVTIVLLIILVTVPPPNVTITSSPSGRSTEYVLVGGQNGTWFQPGQTPRLSKIFLANYSVSHLVPVSGEGTVWGGGWNGSQWLISGFGVDPGPLGSNPYIYLYNGEKQIVAGSLDQYHSESSWHGGDIFAASYNGREWLLSGLGSDSLLTYSDTPINHMSFATFNGYNFTDLSAMVPLQGDAILYANAWNGKYWLVGGGFERVGELFTFDGSKVVDLTPDIEQAIPFFGSVQSIGWNGQYWLIGGFGFLAKYDGHHYVDLSNKLEAALNPQSMCCVGGELNVNAIAWNGTAWMLAGGAPIAQLLPNNAWAVTYTSTGFVNLSPSIQTHIMGGQNSSLLTVAFLNDSWILGGYSSEHGLLLSYRDGSLVDLSSLVDDMSYVTWIGAGSFGQPKVPAVKSSSGITDLFNVLIVILDLNSTKTNSPSKFDL